MATRAPEQYFVTFESNAAGGGTFTVKVQRHWAPLGADRLYNLARLGFYAGTRFYRVVDGWVVQWGVSNDPSVSAVYNYLNGVPGAVIADDPMPACGAGGCNRRGVLSFSAAYGQRADGTLYATNRTTELFINLVDNAAVLDPRGFAPVGEVVEGVGFGGGMAAVDALYAGYGEMADVRRSRGECTTACPGVNETLLYADGGPYLQAHFPLLSVAVTVSVWEAHPGARRSNAGWLAAGVVLAVLTMVAVAAAARRPSPTPPTPPHMRLPEPV